MSQEFWETKSPFNRGQRVVVIGQPELSGLIINVRFDSFGEPIYTLRLDDETQTPDGLFIARKFEIRLVTQ